MEKTILLISCYELGHQPIGLAQPLGFLRDAGYCLESRVEASRVEVMDLSVEGFQTEKIMRAGFVAISVPMHTALRLGVRVAKKIRALNARCHICFYGLYASLNAEYLLDDLADSVIGGE